MTELETSGVGMTALRSIERLDNDKVDRLTEAIRVLVETKESVKWAIGDLLLAELPLMSTEQKLEAARDVQFRGGEPPVQRYLEAVGWRLDLSAETLQSYRVTAAHWPPEMRRHDMPFWKHHALRASSPEEKAELIELPWNEIRTRLGRWNQPKKSQIRKTERSFANISKAAEAAIAVLADEALDPDKRVRIALDILVRFFQDAAVA